MPLLGSTIVGGHAPASAAGFSRKVDVLRAHVLARSWREAAASARALSAEVALPVATHQALREVGEHCDGLAMLGRLREMLQRPWSETDVQTLDAALRHGGEKGGRLKHFLACRAALEGHLDVARDLGAPADGPGLLRDLKRAASTSPREAPAASALGPLIPEGPAMSFRPGVRESLKADLPLMNELTAAEKAARKTALEEIERQARRRAAHVTLLTGRWAMPQPNRPADEPVAVGEPEIDEVVKLLGRRVSEAERVLIRHLRASKDAAETAELLAREDRP
jgi:hypothetical protein